MVMAGRLLRLSAPCRAQLAPLRSLHAFGGAWRAPGELLLRSPLAGASRSAAGCSPPWIRAASSARVVVASAAEAPPASVTTPPAPAVDLASAAPVAAGPGGDAPASVPSGTLEERVRALEIALELQQKKLVEVEEVAKKKGGIMQFIVQYGFPFVCWYVFVWAASWFVIFSALQLEIVSFQSTVKPLLASWGLGAYVENIDPSMGNVVISFILNEVVEPIRFPLVLLSAKPVLKVITGLRVRFFGYVPPL